MVTQLLIDILTNQSERLSGEDIKNIVEAIQLSESMIKPEKDKDQKSPEQIIKEWMGD